MGPEALLPRQPDLFGKFQVTDRLCLKKQRRQHLVINIQS